MCPPTSGVFFCADTQIYQTLFGGAFPAWPWVQGVWEAGRPHSLPGRAEIFMQTKRSRGDGKENKQPRDSARQKSRDGAGSWCIPITSNTVPACYWPRWGKLGKWGDFTRGKTPAGRGSETSQGTEGEGPCEHCRGSSTVTVFLVDYLHRVRDTKGRAGLFSQPEKQRQDTEEAFLMLLGVGKLRHGRGVGGTRPPSPPMAQWIPLREGAGSWGPLCWGTLSRAGAEPQNAARCPGAPKFKGRSLKSRICCSQPRGAPAPSTPPHRSEGVGVQDGAGWTPSPGARGSASTRGCWGWHSTRVAARGGICRALFSRNPSTQPWLRGQFGGGRTPRQLVQVGGVTLPPRGFAAWWCQRFLAGGTVCSPSSPRGGWQRLASPVNIRVICG